MRKINKKESKKDFKNHMVESLELPKDLVYRAAIVTVMGNRELLLENYKGNLRIRERIYQDSGEKLPDSCPWEKSQHFLLYE